MDRSMLVTILSAALHPLFVLFAILAVVLALFSANS